MAGSFGHHLRGAGVDVLIVEGRAQRPSILVVEGGRARLRSAEWLWGMPTSEAVRLIKEALGPTAKAAVIGPAGEHLVKYASIITDDRRAFGRGGAGAVMGSKNLKAVVVKGMARPPRLAEPEKYRALLRRVVGHLSSSPKVKQFREVGTQAAPLQVAGWGILPSYNWRKSVFEGATKISYPLLRERFVVKDVGCFNCPIKCTKLTLVREGDYAGAFSAGPDYEALYALGSCCGIDCAEALIAADMLCDDLGLDVISTGVAVAFAMECCERGLIDDQGLGLRFGNHEALIKAIKLIAYRRGLGDLLADGVKEASAKVGHGSERFAMHVKGLELGGYDPRGSKGQGLVFAVGSRGGCHHSLGIVARVEAGRPDRLLIEGKARLVKEMAEEWVAYDSACVCAFSTARDAIPLSTLAELLEYSTGSSFNEQDLRRAGSRALTVERVFNCREGLTRRDDDLPPRILEESVEEGPVKGASLTREELEALKTQFYSEMGWDPSTGVPTPKTLSDLELTSLVKLT